MPPHALLSSRSRDLSLYTYLDILASSELNLPEISLILSDPFRALIYLARDQHKNFIWNMETEIEKEYQHFPLADPLRDIRLVELLPAEFGDELRLRIFHAPLCEAATPEDNRLALAQLRKLLPEQWLVHTTVEGRYIFENHHHQGHGSWQWACPAKDVSPLSYLHPKDGAEDLQPRYEALSYTWGEVGDRGIIVVEPQQSTVDRSPRYRSRKTS
jgi:hypothetical protein